MKPDPEWNSLDDYLAQHQSILCVYFILKRLEFNRHRVKDPLAIIEHWQLKCVHKTPGQKFPTTCKVWSPNQSKI